MKLFDEYPTDMENLLRFHSLLSCYKNKLDVYLFKRKCEKLHNQSEIENSHISNLYIKNEHKEWNVHSCRETEQTLLIALNPV